MTKYLIIILSLFVFNIENVRAKNISVQELHHSLKSGTSKSIILDVRTPREIKNSGIIKGAKVKNAYDKNFASFIRNLDPSKSYVIYCHSGARSASTVRLMKKYGLKGFNLSGGIVDWKKSGFPLRKLSNNR